MGTKTHALTRDELGRYIDLITRLSGPLLPYAAIAAIITGTGARIGEVLALRMGDIFDQHGKPLPEITRTLEKKRSSTPVRLSVFFPWDTLGAPVIRWRDEARRRFLISRTSLLFSLRYSGEPMNRVHCWRVHRELLQRAGIDPRGVAFHGIRKTFLTAMCAERERLQGSAGMITVMRSMQKLAGHSRFDTTLDYLQDYIGLPHQQVSDGLLSFLVNW